MTLKEARYNIGERVYFEPHENCPKSLIKFGEIVGTNKTYVYVKFDNFTHNQATEPEKIHLLN